ncbi:MAG: flippase [Patescibacteria group bacterium]
MSETRLLAWNTAAQALGKVISTALGVVVVGLMTRLLGQSGFGMYTTAVAFFQIFALMLDLGINVMLVQMLGERAGDKAYEDRAVSATFTFRILTALILLSAAPLVGLFLDYPWALKLALFAIWGSFFSSALNQIVIGAQQRHLKMKMVAVAEVVGRVVLLAGVLLAYYLHWGLVPLALIISIAGFANLALNLLAARHFASFKWNWDPAFWKILISRAWPIGLSILFNLIYFKADTLVLSYVRPFTEVGVYGAAYRVLEILVTLPFMYSGVLLPMIANAWAKQDRARFQQLMRNSYTAMTLLAAPMLAGTFVLGERIMTFVAGPDFTASGGVLKILMLAVAIIFFGTVSSHAVVALDAQRRAIPLYVVTALVTLAGYIIFIPQYGMWAAAWLTVGSECAVALGTTLLSLHLSQTRLDWSPIIKSLLCAAAMALAIQPLKAAWLPLPIFAGAAIYIILTLVTGVVSRQALKELLPFRRNAADLTPPLV